MLDFLFASGTDTELSVGVTIATIVVAVVLGLVISLTYMITSRKTGFSQNFCLTIIMVPAIIAIIILLVGSNVARAFSLAGAFSIIRFRSAPGDPKDITYIFFAMAAGLACGVGLMGYAALFTVVLCLVMYVLSITNFGKGKVQQRLLKITIPEDLDYKGVFDEILNQYTKSHTLKRVRSADLGTVFELSYNLVANDDMDEKELLDLIRCRNGNLDVSLVMQPQEESFK